MSVGPVAARGAQCPVRYLMRYRAAYLGHGLVGSLPAGTIRSDWFGLRVANRPLLALASGVRCPAGGRGLDIWVGKGHRR